MTFSGFSRDTLYTPVPNPLFGHLLEEIDDLAEFKVVMRGIWLCHRQRGSPRMTPLAEFVNDRALLRGLGGPGRDASRRYGGGCGWRWSGGCFSGTRLNRRTAVGSITC